MSREFHPCAFCCALTNGVDADGDPACRPGHGCTVKRKQPRASKPWTRWSNNDVEIVRRGYACGTPVKDIALALNRSMRAILALAQARGYAHASKSRKVTANG